jgi:hypothetical protein
MITFMNNIFRSKWCGECTVWHINSPDLTPFNLFVMVHEKQWLMCNVLLPLISLRANIVAAFPHITPDMLKVA